VRDVDWYRRPEQILAELIDKTARGEKERSQYRAVVIAVDLDGGKLQNPDGSGELIVKGRDGKSRSFKALIGPPNPRGSVKARILTDAFDALLEDQDLRVFWPMFPQDLSGTPATPGEHVYVMFEDVGMAHGIWITRVAGHESANSADGTESYTAPSAPQTAMDSFEDNGPEYARDDDSAGLAPTRGAMTAFGDGDV
jgi:hypothetical protein